MFIMFLLGDVMLELIYENCSVRGIHAIAAETFINASALFDALWNDYLSSSCYLETNEIFLVVRHPSRIPISFDFILFCDAIRFYYAHSSHSYACN